MSTPGRTDPLDAIGEVFHAAYDGIRDGLRREVPVLVVSPTELVLHRQDQRFVEPYSRPLFARAKTAAHVAVALFTLTGADAGDNGVALAGLSGHICAALADSQRSQDEVDGLLEQCRDFARAAREGRATEQVRAAFASDAGPRILDVTELATCEQIAGLHAAVEAMFARLSAHERAELQVVIIGDHQARTRSLGMQYFKRRFREGSTDERVTYGENVDSEEEAIELVATRRLDQRIATAFFGDEHRLQRDVLGDAAQRCLERMEFPS